MTLLKINKDEIFWYKISGEGEPLVHIHGSAFGHKNFEKMTPYMLNKFQVIDFDLIGYGDSKGKNRQGGIEGIADQVSDFIKALKFSKVHIHGTSFGAMVGIIIAYKYPELIDKLVLSCFLTKYDNAARMMRDTWKRAALESGMDAVADLTAVAGFARSFYDRNEASHQLESMREAFKRTTPDAFISGTKMIEKSDLSHMANEITLPILILSGDEDNMTPFKPSQSGSGMFEFSKDTPNCQVEVIEKCGHYLVIEQPKIATDLIIKFLKK
ncbi:MAG: alpha/beta hydrolase [Pseudomonadota bacterium]|nr:alpha/beta hydrolase [Pseudomonadota bacterium]